MHYFHRVYPLRTAVKYRTLSMRYDCTSKEYKYLLLNSDYRNPFLFKRALYYPYYIDTDMLNSEAQDFIGTHDFSAFAPQEAALKVKYALLKMLL